MHTVGTPFLWISFSVLSIVMMVIEIGFQKKSILVKKPLQSAIFLSLLWLGIVLLFSIILWFSIKKNISYNVANIKILSFFSSYFLEQFLSIDNIFVWFLLFRYFSIPVTYQRKVLVYGLLGAILFRIIIIFSVNWLFSKCYWIIYVFGIVLLFTGIKILFYEDTTIEKVKESRWMSWIYKKLRITTQLAGDKFFTWENDLLFFTPLFLVSILIELSDIIFAIDSISAIFSITMDPFIIITSNLLAILNLRSMYFLLSCFEKKINFIKYGIGFILIFISFKILTEYFFHISEFYYLIIIGIILGVSVFLNFIMYNKKNILKKNKNHFTDNI